MGPATLDLWVVAAVPVEDFQATITEVRPSAGQEEYVTSGFLRSTNQVDRPDSTALFTDPTYLAGDVQNLSSNAYSLVKIPIDPIVHTFRPGTELRVVISAPGGRPARSGSSTRWTTGSGQRSAIGGPTGSALVVNIVSGVQATRALPACNALRGEPCRPYRAEGNQ